MTDNLKRLLLVIYRWIGSFFGAGPDAVAPTPEQARPQSEKERLRAEFLASASKLSEPDKLILLEAMRDLVRRLKEAKAAEEANTAPHLPPITTTGPEPTRLPLILLALLVPSIAVAAPPRAIITGPTTAIPGELLTLDATSSENEPKHFKWSISPELRGRKQLEPNGGKCVVATYPGVYVVTLAISNDDGIDTLTYQLTFPGEAPCPPPAPKPVVPDVPIPPVPVPTPTPNPPVPTPPGPVPTPVIPDGEFKVSAKVAALIGKINSPNRSTEAKQLADAADSLAAEVAAGTVTNATVVLTRIGAGIKDIKNPQWVAAATEFAALMQSTWQEHSKGRLKLTTIGGIVDASGWSTLLRELAVGARAVK